MCSFYLNILPEAARNVFKVLCLKISQSIRRPKIRKKSEKFCAFIYPQIHCSKKEIVASSQIGIMDHTKVNAEALSSAKNMKSVAAILLPTSAPLLIANIRAQPLLCLTATVLSLILMRMTINTSSQAATSCKISFSKAKEKAAIENVTITSLLNRITRVSMGSCHLLGGVVYALRKFDGHSAIVSWSLVAGQCLVSGIWLSSGANGQ